MELVKRLYDERRNTWEQAKELLDRVADESRDLSAEEETSYRAMGDRMDALDARIRELSEQDERAKASEAAVRALLDRPVERPTQGQRDEHAELRAFFRGESGKRALDVRPANGPVDFRTLEKKTATKGPESVKTSFYDRLVAHLIEVSGVLQTGPTVLTTASGEDLLIPKTTAHSSNAAIVAESTALPTNEPTFGQVTLKAFKYGMLLQVSHELLNDTSVDLMGYLAMQAGRALGNGFGAHLVTGTGTGQPTGVVTASSLGKTGGTGVTGAFTADDVIDLFYSVIAPYRASGSASWLMQDGTVARVRKLKGSDNNYLWQPGLQAGAPDLLLGKPIVTDPNVAAVALSAKSVLFGDFSQYFVRNVESIRFERSDDYAFNTDVTTFRAILRGDGNLVDTTGAVKHFAGAAT